MTPEQKKLARHALGLDNTDRKRSYRNRYIAAIDSPAYHQWKLLILDGMAVQEGWRAELQNSVLFSLTRKGAEAALDPGETLDPEDFPVQAAA